MNIVIPYDIGNVIMEAIPVAAGMYAPKLIPMPMINAAIAIRKPQIAPIAPDTLAKDIGSIFFSVFNKSP